MLSKISGARQELSRLREALPPFTDEPVAKQLQFGDDGLNFRSLDFGSASKDPVPGSSLFAQRNDRIDSRGARGWNVTRDQRDDR